MDYEFQSLIKKTSHIPVDDEVHICDNDKEIKITSTGTTKQSKSSANNQGSATINWPSLWLSRKARVHSEHHCRRLPQKKNAIGGLRVGHLKLSCLIVCLQNAGCFPRKN